MMANKKDNERDRYFTFFWFENEIKQSREKIKADEEKLCESASERDNLKFLIDYYSLRS